MKKGDAVIYLVIALSILSVYLVNIPPRGEGLLIVEVRVHSEVVDRFLLTETIDKAYQTEFGYNRIRIENQRVRMVEADCRDQICVHTKAGTQARDAIVCVPNRVTIEVMGEGGDIDAISQ